MAARRDQEILPAGCGKEAFQPIVVRIDRSGGASPFALLSRLELERSLVSAHGCKEVCRRDKDRELELWLC